MRPAIFWALFLAACSTEPPTAKPIPKAPAPSVVWGDGMEVDEDGTLLVGFGEVEVGGRRSIPVALENRSDRKVVLVSRPIEGPFSISPERVEIGPGSSADVLFSFSPKGPGGYFENFVFDDENGKFSVIARLEGVGRAGEEDPCLLELETTALIFTVGEEEPGIAGEGRVWIRATGGGHCGIDRIRVEGDDAFSTSMRDLALIPGSRWFIPVSFSPRPGAKGALVFEAAGNEFRVPLGTSDRPRCARVIEHRTSGSIACGENPWAVIENGCSEPIGTASVQTLSAYSLGARLGKDVLFATERGALDISIRGSDGSQRQAALVVLSFDNGDRLYFPVDVELAFVESEYVRRGPPDYLLVVIDGSSAMVPFLDDVADLARMTAAMIEWNWNADMHVGVTTTSLEESGGCGGEAGRLVPLDGSRPLVVNADTPGLEEVLLRNFAVGTCAPPGRGAGLEAARLAAGTDEGDPTWFPLNEQPTVFILSAEDDHSPMPVSYYQTRLRRHIVRLVVPTAECESLEPASRYREFAGFEDDRLLPICDSSRWWWDLFFPPSIFSQPPIFSWPLYPPPLDWNDDGVVDEGDGLLLFHDGNPLPSVLPSGDRLWTFDGASVWFDPVPPFFHARSVLTARYPEVCAPP